MIKTTDERAIDVKRADGGPCLYDAWLIERRFPIVAAAIRGGHIESQQVRFNGTWYEMRRGPTATA